MGYTHQDIVDDYEYLTSSEILLLSIINCGPAKATRIQKLGLFIERILDVDPEIAHGSYNYGAYSDELDEAVSSMKGDGAIRQTQEGYELTQYGSDLLAESKNDPKNKDLVQEIPSIVSFLDSLSDQQLLKLSYILYSDTTDKSLIKGRMNLSKDVYSIGDITVSIGLSRQQLKAKIIEHFDSLDQIIDMLEEGRSVVVSSDGKSGLLLTLQSGRYILAKRSKNE